MLKFFEGLDNWLVTDYWGEVHSVNDTVAILTLQKIICICAFRIGRWSVTKKWSNASKKDNSVQTQKVKCRIYKPLSIFHLWTLTS